jgi:hypothetical protein
MPTADHAPFARIECNEAPSASVFWMMAVSIPLLGFLIIWIAGVPFRFDINERDFNPLVFIPVVAVFVGLFFLVSAVFMTLRLRRFGVSTLALDMKPRVGGHVRGRITSTVDVTAAEWRLVLRCIESIKAISGGTSSVTHRSDVERWKFELTMPGAACTIGAGVPIDIAIPENALALHDPIERARQHRGTLRWVLSLRGRRDGLDYLASFEIPIRATDPARPPV